MPVGAAGKSAGGRGRRACCSTMRHAAASGSAKQASRSVSWSGTTYRFSAGSVQNSANVPSLPMMPSTVRPGAWLRTKIGSLCSQGTSLQLISPTTRWPTSPGSHGHSATTPTNSCPRVLSNPGT